MKSKLKKTAFVLLVPFGSWAVLCNFESIAMIKEHREITVQQPREKVFAFLTDDSKVSTWVKGIVSIEPFGEPKEGVGAKARLAINVPTKMEFVSTVTASLGTLASARATACRVRPVWPAMSDAVRSVGINL